MLYNQPGMIHPDQAEDEMYVDIGVYGPPKAKGFDAIPSTKRIEAYVIKVNG